MVVAATDSSAQPIYCTYHTLSIMMAGHGYSHSLENICTYAVHTLPLPGRFQRNVPRHAPRARRLLRSWTSQHFRKKCASLTHDTHQSTATTTALYIFFQEQYFALLIERACQLHHFGRAKGATSSTPYIIDIHVYIYGVRVQKRKGKNRTTALS